VHPIQVEHRIDLPDQMIKRHHLVEIKRVKELPLSALSLPHHGPLPRITVSIRRNHGSPIVSTSVLQHNRGKADISGDAGATLNKRRPLCWKKLLSDARTSRFIRSA
jgi:hypothetical protein